MIQRTFLVFTFCLITPMSMLGQDEADDDDSGELLVTITNEANRPLEGSTVTVESRAGTLYEVESDVEGKAMFEDLPVGLYRVVVEQTGFISAEEPDVRVVRGKTVPIDLMLLRDRREDMEEIVVTGGTFRGDIYGGISTWYFDREHLRTATGSGADVLRALDGLPGMLSTGEFANFTVRGRGPRDNLILVDGFPFDKVVHFDDSLGEQEDISGGGRFSIFAPNLIDGVEFSPGGWSAAYSGRNGSLLKLDVASGNPSPTASFRLDLAGIELVYDGPSGINDNTSIIATARQFNFGRLFDVIGERDIGSPVMTDIVLKTHTRLNPVHEFEVLVLFAPESSERTVENVMYSENLEDRELLYTNQDSLLIGITSKRLFGDDGILANRFYYRNSDKTSREGEAYPFSVPVPLPANEIPAWEDIITLTESEREIGLRSDLSIGNRWGLFSTGIRIADINLAFSTTLAGDWIRYEYDSTDYQSDSSARYIVLTPEHTNSMLARRERQISVYSEQVFVVPNKNLRVGFRYDRDGFSREGYLSPRISANYQIDSRTRLAATLGTFYQSPRFLELAADPGNAELRSERMDHMSIGIDRQFGERWNTLVEAYYRQFSDLVTDGDAVTGLATNAGKGTAIGLDAVLNRRFGNRFSGNAVYSFNDARYEDPERQKTYPTDYNHRHIFSVGGRWEINQRWQAGFRWKFATGRPRNEFVVHEDVLAPIGGPLRYSTEFITRNTARWDNFHTLNVRLDYRRPIGPVDFIGFLDILNLYGGAASDEREFNPATGVIVEDEGDSFPLLGLRFEKTW